MRKINARQPNTQIARTTGLPIDVVKYRIKRLEQVGIIRSYHACLDPIKLGYPIYAYVVLSLYNLMPELEKLFIGYLTAQPNIFYVSRNSGRWDFVIGVCAKNYIELDQVLREIRSRFPNSIKESETIPVIAEFKYDWMTDLIED